MKLLAALLMTAAAWAVEPGFIYSATFPYQEYPRDLWAGELVRLKAMGFNAVRVDGGGAAEVTELARLARRLGLKVWLESPVQAPELEPFRAVRGGPILEKPSGRAARLVDPSNYLFAVREAWAAGVKVINCGTMVEEQRVVLARHGALTRNLGKLLATVEPRPGARWRWGVPPRAVLPRGLRLAWLAAPGPRGPAFISALNPSDGPVAGGVLTVTDPRTARPLTLRSVNLPARQALWMPVNLPLAMPEVCPTCSSFAPDERLVSATAELVSVSFENGVLAMEFVAPGEGELVLELARQPEGPLLAGAMLRTFDWDAKTHRLKLRIPAGRAPEFRSRVGLGIELPDSSVFLKAPKRLILGSTAVVTATFSSPELAGRARLLAPAGWRVRPESRGKSEIDYQVEVPAEAVAGDMVTLAVEAEGKVAQSMTLPLAPFCSLRIDPEELFEWRRGKVRAIRPHLAATVLPRRRTYGIRLRNQSDEIRTFELVAAGEGLEFQPSQVEAVVAGGLEREVTLSALAPGGRPGLYRWNLVVREGSQVVETPMALAVISPDEALVYQLDIDRDGAAEWVLENQKIRVVVSPREGGRLLEFRLKGREVVGREVGAGAGPAEVRVVGAGKVEVGEGQARRRISLGAADAFFEVEGRLTVEPAPGVRVEGSRVSLAPAASTEPRP